MPKKPPPVPPPESEEQPEPKLPLLTFPRAPISGTGLVIRGSSRGQFAEATADLANPELSDRELVVRFVQRQVEPEQSIDEVRSWADAQLLEAAELLLSFLPIVRLDEDEHIIVGSMPGDTEAMSILPSFGKVRRKLAERAERQDRRNQQLMAAYNEMAKSGIGHLTLPGADLLKIIGDSTRQADTLKHILDTGGPGIVTRSTAAAIAAGLAATNVIGPIGRMMADTEAMKKLLPPAGLGGLPESPVVQFPRIENPQYKVLRAANTTNEILEKMNDNQAAFAEDQTEAMVGLSKEVAEQTKTIQGVKDSIDKLVASDELQLPTRNRSFRLLVLTAAISFAALLYVSGVLHPFGLSQPAPASTVAPSASPSPTPAASQSPIIPTPSAVAPTPAPSQPKPSA